MGTFPVKNGMWGGKGLDLGAGHPPHMIPVHVRNIGPTHQLK